MIIFRSKYLIINQMSKEMLNSRALEIMIKSPFPSPFPQ